MTLSMIICFFSSRRRHTRCALVTGVQTVALPISGGIEPFDANEVGKAALAAAAGQDDDDVDRLGDQRARDMRYGFKDQLLEPVPRGACRSGMDRAEAAGMAGAPRLEQIARVGAAHFADRDDIGTERTGSASCRERGCQYVWLS